MDWPLSILSINAPVKYIIAKYIAPANLKNQPAIQTVVRKTRLARMSGSNADVWEPTGASGRRSAAHPPHHYLTCHRRVHPTGPAHVGPYQWGAHALLSDSGRTSSSVSPEASP